VKGPEGVAIAAVTTMAAKDKAVKALGLVGSRARGAARPDSDVDFVLLTDKPERYLVDDWRLDELDLLGPAERSSPRTRGALTERRIAMPGVPPVELNVGLAGWAATNPVDPGSRRVVVDGMRLLHDPEHLLGDLAAACATAARPWLPDNMTWRNPEVELRDWTEDDAPALGPVCGDPDVCRFTSVPWTYSPEAALAWVERLRELRAAGEGMALAITAPGRPQEPLGTVNLVRFSADGREAALGYWLLPAARGRGYATAAARALARWGFRSLHLERIELAILPENAASRRLAERLGARFDGIRPDSHEAEGRSWEMAIYSLEPSFAYSGD
jgi:RimJ/RimL family protein N-acetyltransferase